MSMKERLKQVLVHTGSYSAALSVFKVAQDLLLRLETFVWLPLLQHCAFLRRVHFGFFSSSFSSEMRLYVIGRRYYLKLKLNNKANPYLLRRNIHRIEKGLMAPAAKAVFALDYIEETVLQFVAGVRQEGPSALYDWAFDVLSTYFTRVEPLDEVLQARSLFEGLAYRKEKAELFFGPYAAVSSSSDALYAGFAQLVAERKSVRSFVSNSIPPMEVLERAVALAALAPSSCNRQPFRFVVIKDADRVGRLARLAGGARTFAHEIPALVVLVGSLGVSPSAGDRHLMYIDGSLAAMNFMLALQSQAYASCPINWPDQDKADAEMAHALGLASYERPLMLIAVGKAAPGAMVACSTRKGVKELLEVK